MLAEVDVGDSFLRHTVVLHVSCQSSRNRIRPYIKSYHGFYPRGASDAQVIAIIVCPSVCLSVCHTPVLYQTAKRRIMQSTPLDSPVDICAQSDQPPFQKPQFQPIFVHSASIVKAGENNVQLTLIGSRPRAFQRAIDEPCTLPLSLPKGGTKRDCAVFSQ